MGKSQREAQTTLEGLAVRDDSGTQTTGGAGEEGQVSAQHSDFSKDKHRAAVSDEQRDSLVWRLSSFFIGRERMTTQISGLVLAYDNEREGFLVPHPWLESISVPLPGALARI